MSSKVQYSTGSLLIWVSLLCIFAGTNAVPGTIEVDELQSCFSLDCFLLAGNLLESDVQYYGWPLPCYAFYPAGYISHLEWLPWDVRPRYRFFMTWAALLNIVAFLLTGWLCLVAKRWYVYRREGSKSS